MRELIRYEIPFISVGQAHRLLQLTKRQLQYWADSGLYGPSIKRGTGKAKVYSVFDVCILYCVSQLLKCGLSVQELRKGKLRCIVTFIKELLQHENVKLEDIRVVFWKGEIFVLYGEVMTTIPGWRNTSIFLNTIIQAILRMDIPLIVRQRLYRKLTDLTEEPTQDTLEPNIEQNEDGELEIHSDELS